MHPTESPAATVIAAIPARYASTRLPGKPLLKLAGRPMIEHVYRRAERAEGLSRVVVLTDDERIAEVVEGFGGEWLMTPTSCPSGTDRIAAAATEWEGEAVINVQGDEPLIEPEAISQVARCLATQEGDAVVTLAAPGGSEDRDDPNTVKVVFDAEGRALYFSRAGIPFPRTDASGVLWKHIGIYGYPRSTLLRLANLPQSPLEKTEALEQLRALENGVTIRVLTVPKAWPGVDTMEDLNEVERLLAHSARGGEG